MIGYKCPRITGCIGFRKYFSQTSDKIIPVIVIPENIASFNASYHNVVKGACSVYPCFSGHKYILCIFPYSVNFKS